MVELVPVVELGLIATAVAVAAKYVRIPYTIALVLAGLVMGFSSALELHLSKELILLLLLPPLLFEGALHMDLDRLRRYATPVGLLALVGTLVSAGVIGAVAHVALGLGWGGALLLGVILSPTDPVSVLAMFKDYGAPKGLQMILEGESVFNDAIGIVLYLIVLETLGGAAFSPTGAVVEFLTVALGGAAIGLATGYLAHRLMGRLDDHLVETMISLVLAFGSYALAETLHVSGVVSTVVAGLIIGNYGTVLSMSPTTRLTLVNFWSVAAFVVNSAVFLLIGLDFDSARLPANLTAILVAIAAALVARSIAVYALVPISNRLTRRVFTVGPAWAHALNWGGLRGTIPIALALGLEPGLRDPNGVHLPTVVFGVALFSLVVQGLTMKPLLSKLGLIGAEGYRLEFETQLAQTVALGAALEELERSSREVGAELYATTRGDLDEQLAAANTTLERLTLEHPGLSASRAERLNRQLIVAEKAAVAEALRRGLIGEEAASAVNERVDAALEMGERPSFRPEPGT